MRTVTRQRKKSLWGRWVWAVRQPACHVDFLPVAAALVTRSQAAALLRGCSLPACLQWSHQCWLAAQKARCLSLPQQGLAPYSGGEEHKAGEQAGGAGDEKVGDKEPAGFPAVSPFAYSPCPLLLPVPRAGCRARASPCSLAQQLHSRAPAGLVAAQRRLAESQAAPDC